MKKTLITVICTVLVCCGIAGSTYAWLMDRTDPVTNTFTAGNINITLSESTARNNKMIPGTLISEDPKVTVKANSEDCWLFIKITKSDNFDTFLNYRIEADVWHSLENEEGVFYCEVASLDSDQPFYIFSDNKVYVKPGVTKEQYDAIGEENQPSLSFTAYAVQRLGFDTPASAWEEAKNLEYVTL